MWALDYQFDVSATKRTLKILHVVDEFIRNSFADVLAHGIDADATVAVWTRSPPPGAAPRPWTHAERYQSETSRAVTPEPGIREPYPRPWT